MHISLKDTCEIFRATGVTDQWDNDVVDTIYSGPCLYQERTTVNYLSGVATRKPLMFLRNAGSIILINDVVNVTTADGREERATVKLVRDIEVGGSKYVRIELMAGQGD